ncbi:MAG: hypothetical protein WCI05_05140 [Myxococcales bacterium]
MPQRSPWVSAPAGSGAGSVARGVQFVDLLLATFQQQVAQLNALVTQAATLVVNPTARKFPASFETLGNLDFGVDPNKFEVELVSERLAKAASGGASKT